MSSMLTIFSFGEAYFAGRTLKLIKLVEAVYLIQLRAFQHLDHAQRRLTTITMRTTLFADQYA